jgi:hypothetical protein
LGVCRGSPYSFGCGWHELPVGKGEFVNREQLVLTRSGKDPSGAERKIKGNALVSVLAYGINGKLTLFGILPYIDKEFSFPMR